MTTPAPATTPWWGGSLVVFDLETTGVDPTSDRIVTAYLALTDPDGQPTDVYSAIVNPGVPIPDQAAAVHGVTTEHAQAHGIDPAVAVAALAAHITDYQAKGIPLVVYNASYDLTMLTFEAARHGVHFPEPALVIDPLVIDKTLDKYRRGKRTLTVTAAHYGITLDNAHTADADALVAGLIARAIPKVHPGAPSDAADLHDRQRGWKAEQDASFESYRRRTDSGFTVERGWPVRAAVRAATAPVPS